MNINLCISLAHTTIQFYLFISIIFHSMYISTFYILQYSIHFILSSYKIQYIPLIFHLPIHFPSMPFKKKRKKKSTFPIQLHSSHPFLTSFSKPIYINNRRNCLKNRFNFHLKLTASVILTPSYQPLTREPIKQMENGGKTRKFVWNITRHILVYSI